MNKLTQALSKPPTCRRCNSLKYSPHKPVCQEANSLPSGAQTPPEVSIPPNQENSVAKMVLTP